jgi:ABC-type nitrate/sulfonate/bicarbonate transport system substrate-binding protein
VVVALVVACSVGAPPAVAPSTAPAPTTAATAVASGSATGLPAPEVSSIALGTNAITANNFAVKHALDLGLYEKHGLDATVTLFEGTQSTTALQANQIQVLRGEDQAVFFSQRTSTPMIMVASFYGKFLDDLVGAADVMTADDLRGKKIASNEFGGQSHREVVVALTHLGLTTDDVEIVAIGGQSDRVAALENGAVAATVMDTSASADLAAQGFNIIVKLGELTERQALGPIITTKKFADENPNTVLAVIAAMLEAQHQMFVDKETAVTGLAEWEQVEEDEAEGELDEFLEAAVRDLRFTREGMVELQKFLALVDPSVADVNVDDAFDLRFLDQLEDLGYYQKVGVPGY